MAVHIRGNVLFVARKVVKNARRIFAVIINYPPRYSLRIYDF